MLIRGVCMQTIIYVLLLFLMSCTSTNKSRSDSSQSIALELNKGFSENLPPSLWSETRRKVNAMYYFFVAEYELMQGRLKQSGEFYNAAYSLEPSAFLGQKMIASLAEGGQKSSALEFAKKMSLLYPTDAEVHNLYGKLLFAQGNLEKAQLEFKRALELDAESIQGFIGLINVYQQRKLFSMAIQTAKKMMSKNPNFADGWGVLAKLYLSSTMKRKALSPARRAYDIEPQDPEKILIYALALELSGSSEKAVRLYEILFRFSPGNEDLISRMVRLYRQIGGLEEALALLEEAAARSPSDGVRMQQALIYWEMRRFEEASQILTDLSEKNPDSDRQRYMAGLGYEKVGRFSKAIDSYLDIDESSALYLHSRFRAVRLLRNLKQYQRAIRLVEAVIRMRDSRVVEFYKIGAYIYADLEEIDKALEILSHGLKNFPDQVELLFLRGVYFEKLGKREKCIEAMRLVIDKRPDHHAALNFLGYLYVEKGENLIEAKSLITRALQIKPNDGFYLDSLGWYYYQSGNYLRAQKILIKANDLSPNEGVILEHLGDVERKIGSVEKALQYYKKAIQGRIEKRDRSRVESKIEQIQMRKGGFGS